MGNFKKFIGNTLALEIIAFQKDSFAVDIEHIFNELIGTFIENKVPYNLNQHPLILKISDNTFKRTGIKVNLITNSNLAAVLPFYSNRNHILLHKYFRGKDLNIKDQNKILNQDKEFKGTVDTKNCLVTGVFSEYKTPIYLNIAELIRLKITASELTAIYLHELGHAFYACEYTNRLNTTNQNLSHLLDTVLNKESVPKEYLFKEFKKLSPETKDEIIESVISNDSTILGPNTFNFLKDTVKTQLSISKYDENSFETLADNFAARWGYGKNLVTALEKLPNVEKSLSLNILISTTQIAGIIILINHVINILASVFYTKTPLSFSYLLSSGATIAVSVIIAFIILFIIYSHSSLGTQMTYDDLIYRYKRIKQQLVLNLKDSEIGKEDINSIIEDIKFLDSILENTKTYKLLITKLVDLFVPGTNKLKENIELQRILEDLSANYLHVKAASLRAI